MLRADALKVISLFKITILKKGIGFMKAYQKSIWTLAKARFKTIFQKVEKTTDCLNKIY